MAKFTLDDLVRLLIECAGEEDGVDLHGDIEDVPFDELGYDSLALFNTVGQIEREIGTPLPDDIVGEATTPRALLAEIDRTLRQKV